MAHSTNQTLVWRWPVRFAHYNLLLCLPLLIITGKQGWLYWHAGIGLWLLAVLVFRLGYALFDRHYASLRALFFSPKRSLIYAWSVLRGTEVTPYPGHNPAGSYMVLALWGLLLLQIFLGVFSGGTFLYQGPLAHWLDADLSSQLSQWHTQMPLVIVLLIVVHVLAVLWTQLRLRESILPAMFVHGRKPGQFTRATINKLGVGVAVLAALLMVAFIVWMGGQGGFWSLLP